MFKKNPFISIYVSSVFLLLKQIVYVSSIFLVCLFVNLQ